MAAHETQVRYSVLILSTGVLLFLLLAIFGCTSREAIESARKDGAKTGYSDGRKAGEADGFKQSFPAAKRAAYRKTFHDLYSSAKYARPLLYQFTIGTGSFLVGFALQYVLLYVLRRIGVLNDIDRIILGKSASEVDLTEFTERQ